MNVGLQKGGWGKLEEGIQDIENLAWDGAFSGRGTTAKFQRIAGMAKRLRQTLTEVSVMLPDGGGEVA